MIVSPVFSFLKSLNDYPDLKGIETAFFYHGDLLTCLNDYPDLKGIETEGFSASDRAVPV